MTSTKRVLLLGKTGAGKSSLANTIFGDDIFAVGHFPNSETSKCLSVTKTIYRRTLTLIDTPGVFDTNPTGSVFSSEIIQCMNECAPGPHAFLLVLKVERYTAQEQAVVDLILKYFSPEALKYTTVVFTHGYNLPIGMTITEWAQKNDVLRALLEKCGNRCHVVDNPLWKNQKEIYRNNQNQIQDLLNTIDMTVAANGGSFYSRGMLRDPSLFERFSSAPTGVKMLVILGGAGVVLVECLLYSTVSWEQVIQWVIQGSKYGSDWIRENLRTTDDIIKAMVYLSQLYTLYEEIQTNQKAALSSGSSCTVL